MKRLIAFAAVVLDCIMVVAQPRSESDTLIVERRNNQNVLLNASSDSWA